MLLGYARVSTGGQCLDSQLDALKLAGCEKVFHDVASGSKTIRPQLEKLLSQLRPGDILVVPRLDRLGRSLKHLISLITNLNENNVGFKSLADGFDTSTNGGRLVFHLFSAIAEFERNLIVERVNMGLKAARARGRKGGRRPALSPKQLSRMFALYDERKSTVVEICALFKITRSGFYKMLSKHRPDPKLKIPTSNNHKEKKDVG